MKKILLKLLFSLILCPLFMVGQNPPSSADNSTWFPPVEQQMHANCSQFSLIYYLKSYLWNKHFQRNPDLPENQFSADFVWNQTINNTSHFSNNNSAFVLMSKQGCATVSNFPLQTDQENLPSLEVMEGGLNFRSKSLVDTWLTSYDSVSVSNWLNNLKDSLSQGVCFSFPIPMFEEINEVTAEDPVYRWNAGVSQNNILGSHAVVVVGYNDSLQVLKMINSWGTDFGDNGYFYMTYDWFYNVNFWPWSGGFLKEDFNYLANFSLNLNLSETITGNDIDLRNNIFVDTVYSYINGNYLDYRFSEYFFFSRLITMEKINNQIVPTMSDDGNNTNNIVFLPSHNHNGHRLLLEDLTPYVAANDFISLELLVVDPISSIYKMENDNIVYGYTRTAQATVNEAYLKFLGTPKRIVGQVTDLPDTTIVTNNFYSYPAAFHLTPPSGDPLFIKSCTSVLKRKKITFSIADTINYSEPPSFTSVPSGTLRTKPGNAITFQFKAQDPDSDSLKYYLAAPDPSAQIDSLTGLFQYLGSESVRKQFIVFVTDGLNNVSTNFWLICNNAPTFTVVPTDTLRTKPGTPVTFQFKANDLDNDTLKYSLSSSEPGAQIDSLTGLFTYQSDDLITKTFTVKVSDGIDEVSKSFVVKVKYALGVDENREVEATASLSQNYPNPFYAQTTISFTLLREGYASLRVYNLLGQEVRTLLDRHLNPGTFNLQFSAGDLPTGVYTYCLRVDGYLITKKMLIGEQVGRR